MFSKRKRQNRIQNIFFASAIATAISVFNFSIAQAGPTWKKVLSSTAGGSAMPAGYQEFTQDGTFTVPAGVTKIYTIVIGAGGGGGSQNSGGGGGGGSCIKNGASVLTSANGGDGGAFQKPGFRGTTVYSTQTVTAGATLNVYVGGGGGGAGLQPGSSNNYGGSGGYGACGNGGAGGAGSSGAGGAGGANKGGGGGGGGSGAQAGTASASSVGGAAAYTAPTAGTCAVGTAGSSTASGTSGGCGPGGGSGAIGGSYGNAAGQLGTNTAGTYTVGHVRLEPGENGAYVFGTDGTNYTYMGTGGGPGFVAIWW